MAVRNGVNKKQSEKFIKKPVPVGAIQWYPDPKLGISKKGKALSLRIGTDKHGVEYTVCDVGLRTLEGFMHIRPGDWIVTGVAGERYPVHAGIFATTYESESARNKRVGALICKFANKAMRYPGKTDIPVTTDPGWIHGCMQELVEGLLK